MKILHTSDLHGSWKKLFQATDFDLWVDTGDFFPNITRGGAVEPAFQRAWFTTNRMSLKKRFRAKSDFWPTRKEAPPFEDCIAERITDWLKGRPVISVSGNHDWVNLADMLRASGYPNVWNVSQGPTTVGGLRFAGFREVAFVTGEWQGELGRGVLGLTEAKPLVVAAMSHEPDVLVTHSPPAGILDYAPPKGGRVGLPALAQHLAYKPHHVRYHLFGHVHEEPGIVKEMDITFSNAAGGGRIIEVK